MYYLICILFYVAFLFAAFMLLKYILKKPEKNDKKKVCIRFLGEVNECTQPFIYPIKKEKG